MMGDAFGPRPRASRRALLHGLALTASVAIAGCTPEPERTFQQCMDTGAPNDTQGKLEAQVDACLKVAAVASGKPAQ